MRVFIEVERIEHIPAGLMAWVLDTHSLSVFEVKNGKHVIIWQAAPSTNYER